ncbi:hypothetical protein SNEBB_006259 [Seison nebaliae]|nr:hypothetical protein SNEBB_006259 [Seison nebaliae]
MKMFLELTFLLLTQIVRIDGGVFKIISPYSLAVDDATITLSCPDDHFLMSCNCAETTICDGIIVMDGQKCRGYAHSVAIKIEVNCISNSAFDMNHFNRIDAYSKAMTSTTGPTMECPEHTTMLACGFHTPNTGSRTEEHHFGLTTYVGDRENMKCRNMDNTCTPFTGTCKLTYSCVVCKTGYTGLYCHIDIDECTDDAPCQNGATCLNIIGDYKCLCPYGYEDKNCATITDLCSDEIINNCRNGATCTVPTAGTYQCTCPTGFTGDICETDIDECATNICQNGATCTNHRGTYRCHCAKGWQGINCETDLNECFHVNQTEVCQHGGTCTNAPIGSYTCTCPVGWNGDNCETDINECTTGTHECKNSAYCRNTYGAYFCECRTFWTGKFCDIDIDECIRDRNPCLNGATCADNVGAKATCTCTSFWEGEFCQTDINECLTLSPCQHQSDCHNFQGGYLCTCSPGYYGVNCESEYNECASNPCQNNGKCRDLINRFECVCSSYYTGDYCQFDTGLAIFQLIIGCATAGLLTVIFSVAFGVYVFEFINKSKSEKSRLKLMENNIPVNFDHYPASLEPISFQ